MTEQAEFVPENWGTIGPVVADLARRVETLEEFRKGFPDDDDPLGSNTDGITCGTFQPIENYEAKRAERERQERWHRTRDAMLPTLLQMCVESSEYDGEEDPADAAHRLATWHADRAHGPLDKPVVAAEDIAVDPHVFAQAGRFVCTVDVLHLNALVRAARTAAPILSELSHEAAGYAQGALKAALKPFEAVK